MSTAAQISANQSNAKLSTGPTSPKGKAASSQNNFRHGLRGKFTLLPNEDPRTFDCLLQGLRDEHEPTTITGELLVQRMAEHEWLSRRAHLLIEAAMDDNKALAIWLRYQTTHDRGFHKCLADLLRLKSETRKEQIGFERHQQQIAEQSRLQQVAEARTRALNAQAALKEFDVELKCMLQAPLPGNTVISFDEIKPFLNQAIKHYFHAQSLSAASEV